MPVNSNVSLSELKTALTQLGNLPYETLPHWSDRDLAKIAACNALPTLLEIVEAVVEWRALVLGKPQPFESIELAKNRFLSALCKICV